MTQPSDRLRFVPAVEGVSPVVNRDEIDRIFGTTAYDADGDTIGPVGQVYADDESGEPQWVTVRTGLFGTRESFVPLAGASLSGDKLTVPFSKAFVKDAPNLDVDGHLTPQEESDLYAYYRAADGDEANDDSRLRHDEDGSDDSPSAVGDDRRREYDADEDRSERSGGTGLSRPDTDDAMTVSEERLRVGTERRATSRVRLRKVVVTENVTMTVPVQREEVRIEHDPIGDEDGMDEAGNVDDTSANGADSSAARPNEGDHR